MKQFFHFISAKNLGYESVLGDETYDYFFFPADEFSKEESLNQFIPVTQFTKKNNNEYPYTAYKYIGTKYHEENYGKSYYKILYQKIIGEDELSRF